MKLIPHFIKTSIPPLISPSIVTSFYLFYTLLLYSSGLPFGDKYEHANTNTTMKVNKYKSTNTISHTNLEMQQRAIGVKVVIKFYMGVCNNFLV